MQTVVLPVNPVEPEPAVIARAAAVLRGGGLVAFPTETVYGLGANALDAAAVARIFAAKGRPATNPLIVHVAEAAEAVRVAAAWPQAAARLADRFWPGPLTLVLPRRDTVPDAVTAGGPTVAVRVPAHPVARALIRTAGVPVAAPSANRSTQLSPTRPSHVLAGLDGRIDLLLDGGSTAGGLESTVLDVTASPPRLLRPGLVSPGEIEAVLGGLARPGLLAVTTGQPLPSPGMLGRHYAPRAVLECVEGCGRDRVRDLQGKGVRVGWLAFGGEPEVPGPGLQRVTMPRDPRGYAAELYAVLHTLDAAGVDWIIAELPPDTDAWLAVRDRLRRAGTPG
jgi:L-threonylcarbamoyladenylate synthase